MSVIKRRGKRFVYCPYIIPPTTTRANNYDVLIQKKYFQFDFFKFIIIVFKKSSSVLSDSIFCYCLPKWINEKNKLKWMNK